MEGITSIEKYAFSDCILQEMGILVGGIAGDVFGNAEGYEAYAIGSWTIDAYNASVAEGETCPYHWQTSDGDYPTLVKIAE